MASKAFIMYQRQKVEVIVTSTFEGGNGKMANVQAVSGYPFYSCEVQAQGATCGASKSNGYRLPADFVKVEYVPSAEGI